MQGNPGADVISIGGERKRKGASGAQVRDLRLKLSVCFSSRRRHTRLQGDWSSDVCSSDLSGASSCAELTACGVPSILMPYPYHKDMHQRVNAEELSTAGAAILIDDQKDRQKNAEDRKSVV